MLTSHPNIYIPPESDFIPRFFSKNTWQEMTIKDVKRTLNIIFKQYRFVDEWQGKPPEPLAFYQKMQPKTPSAFLDVLYTMYASQNRAQRWGDKTPIYASYLPLLSDLFPSVKFIHILRDPRDSAASLLEKYQSREFHVDIYFAARNWVRRIRKAQMDGKSLSAHDYFELRYENLVQDPEIELNQICDFLGETYHADMLLSHELAQKTLPVDSYFFENVRKPLTTTRINSWTERLSIRDARLVQEVAGPLMKELGYIPADLGQMSAAERVRLRFLQGKFVVLQAGRRVLQHIGLKPPI
jgi:hypothetical protein